MWPFKRKKKDRAKLPSGPTCIYCGSTNTIAVSTGDNPIKAWRGQRYVTCKCRDCGRDFYSDEIEAAEAQAAAEDIMVDDEEALRTAEEELKRKTDEDNDHRYLPGG
jgi:transcription elongation factor Elf1